MLSLVTNCCPGQPDHMVKGITFSLTLALEVKSGIQQYKWLRTIEYQGYFDGLKNRYFMEISFAILLKITMDRLLNL